MFRANNLKLFLIMSFIIVACIFSSLKFYDIVKQSEENRRNLMNINRDLGFRDLDSHGYYEVLEKKMLRVHQGNFSIWIPRHKCKTNDVVFGVLSIYESARMQIRKTWGEHRCLFFITGRKNNWLPWTEAIKYQDMILMDMDDNYKALTVKTSAWFSFVHYYRPLVQYAIKVDDDSFVRVSDFLKELYESKSDYFGFGLYNTEPIRDPNHRHFQNVITYNHSRYPPYALGAGYALSRRALDCYATKVQDMTALTSEDVNTGVVMDECRVNLFHTFSIIFENWQILVLLQKIFVYVNPMMPGRGYILSHHVDRESGFEIEQKKYVSDVNIEIPLTGRLGNNLFILASASGISKFNRASLCYEGDFLGIDLFEIHVRKCSDKNDNNKAQKTKKTVNFREQGFGVFKMPVLEQNTCLSPEPIISIISSPCNCNMLQSLNNNPCNYFQSYKYFSHVDLQSVFSLKDYWMAYGRNILKSYCKNCLNVGIHVRRGDHVSANYLGIPSASYFKNAMGKFNSFTNVRFYVASDEVEWVKQQGVFQLDNVKNNVKIINTDRDIDFATLVACDHMIISIGTFGWWIAFLGSYSRGGDVIYFEDELVEQEKLGNANRDDYYPSSWIPLGN